VASGELELSSAPRNIAATAALRELIVSKALRGGSPLRQEDLANTLGMSRNPVRLALAQLEHDGLIKATSGGGFVLRSFKRTEIVDSVGLRAALEGDAARLAAMRCDAAEVLERLEKCCEQMERLTTAASTGVGSEFDQYLELNDDFHAMLFSASGSEPLTDAYQHLLHLPFTSPSAVLRASPPDKWLAHRIERGSQQHRGILTAIKSWDETRAEQLARDHALLTKRRLESDFATDPTSLDRLPGGNLAQVDDFEMDAVRSDGWASQTTTRRETQWRTNH
jgi:GntR family transcriptional regulator of vanillate catabolism